jgi:adhesin transport system membrane fusion protein
LKDRSGKSLPIGTGMIADVSLLGDKRTVLEYILSPITKLKDTALRE